MFRYVVLGLLRSGQPQHGYALCKRYRERTGLSIGSGTFYRTLKELAEDGLVQAAANAEHDDARRARYVITPRGAQVFDGWLRTPTASVTAPPVLDELVS